MPGAWKGILVFMLSVVSRGVFGGVVHWWSRQCVASWRELAAWQCTSFSSSNSPDSTPHALPGLTAPGVPLSSISLAVRSAPNDLRSGSGADAAAEADRGVDSTTHAESAAASPAAVLRSTTLLLLVVVVFELRARQMTDWGLLGRAEAEETWAQRV